MTKSSDMRRRQSLSAWMTVATAAAVIAGLIAGCGGDETSDGRARSMVGERTTEESVTTGLREGNQAPVISEIALRPETPARGRVVQASAAVHDSDGDATSVVYRWQTIRGRVLGEGRTFDTSGLEPGSRLEVIATANDGRDSSEPHKRIFRLSQPSMAISLVAIDDGGGRLPGVILTSVVEFTDDASGRAEAELEWKVNGTIVGTEDELDTESFRPGDIVVLRARIGHGRNRFISSSPVVLSGGAVPEITSKPLAGIEGGVFRYRIRAKSDEQDARLAFSLEAGPDGMSVDESSGVVVWRPTVDQRGRFEVKLSVSDQWGGSIAQSFAIVAEGPATSPASLR